jgi:hypothetical protein
MVEKAPNSDRSGDSDAMTPVYVPPEEANGPEQPPVEGLAMAPPPPDEKRPGEDDERREPAKAPPSREG